MPLCQTVRRCILFDAVESVSPAFQTQVQWKTLSLSGLVGCSAVDPAMRIIDCIQVRRPFACDTKA